MAEDNRADAEGAAPRNREGRLGIHLRGGGIQPDAHAETTGQLGWCRMSQGKKCAHARPKHAKGPPVKALSLFGRIENWLVFTKRAADCQKSPFFRSLL